MTTQTRLNEVRGIVAKYFIDQFPDPEDADADPTPFQGTHPIFEPFDTRLLDNGGQLSLGVEEGPRPSDRPWVRLIVRHNERVQETLGRPGHRVFRNEATIYCAIFVPLTAEGGPQYDVDKFAEALTDMWDSTRLPSAVQTYASFARDQAPEESYLQITVETPISYEEMR